MRGQLLLGTGIGEHVVNNYTVYHMLFYLGFYFSPFFITFYFISVTNLSLFQPSFSFPQVPSPFHQGEGWESSCVVLRCQLGLNQDSIFLVPNMGHERSGQSERRQIFSRHRCTGLVVAGHNVGLWCHEIPGGMRVRRALREPSTGESVQLHLPPSLLRHPTEHTHGPTPSSCSWLITTALENSHYPTGVKTTVVPVLGSSVVLNGVQIKEGFVSGDSGRAAAWD